MGVLTTEDNRISISGDRLEQCREASATFKMLCDTCPFTDCWKYETYVAMSLWSNALADAALEAGFEDVAEYERWWANDWLTVANENKSSDPYLQKRV